MKRLVRDAVLVAVTAGCVWFVRGEAQQATPMGYGQAFQLVCQRGEITNVDISEYVRGYNLTWQQSAIQNSAWQSQDNLTGCVAYPDLRTPTP